MKEVPDNKLTRWVSGVLFVGGLFFYLPAVLKYFYWTSDLNFDNSYFDLLACMGLALIGFGLSAIAAMWVAILLLVIRDWLEDH